MKKGYYIFPCGYESTTKEYSGVLKKIEMQCAELRKYFDVDYKLIFEKSPKANIEKIIRRLPWVSANRDYDGLIEEFDDPAFVYIRRVTADKKFVAFLRKIKKKYPSCKIIEEIYSYPYEADEYQRFIDKPSLWKDRHYRKQLKLYVDRFVTYSDDKEIFGVKTINQMNGINVNSIPRIKRKDEKKDTLDLIFVGYMQKHHGLERIIQGLRDYYNDNKQKRIVIVHLVGEGPEIALYKELTGKYNLSSKVIFHGKKYGEELDAVYDMCDVGISSLGFYKINIQVSSALKSREYLAKGMPMINGNPTDVFEKYDCDFYKEFPNNDSPIDIDSVVAWYYALLEKYENAEKLSIAIRQYALEHIDNSVTIKPVRDFIGD